VAVKGSRELRARLRSLKLAFKPIGRSWGDETVRQARPRVPVRTGRLRKSIRVRNNTQRRTTVAAHYTAYFVDKGPKPHAIKAKRARMLVFPIGGRTIFSRAVHHRGYRGRPFRERAARDALRLTPHAQKIIEQWNRAA
jgi:hypothetical protein